MFIVTYKNFLWRSWIIRQWWNVNIKTFYLKLEMHFVTVVTSMRVHDIYWTVLSNHNKWRKKKYKILRWQNLIITKQNDKIKPRKKAFVSLFRTILYITLVYFQQTNTYNYMKKQTKTTGIHRIGTSVPLASYNGRQK